MIGKTDSEAVKERKAARAKFIEERDAKIVKLYTVDDMPTKAIAERLRVSTALVNLALKRAGIDVGTGQQWRGL